LTTTSVLPWPAAAVTSKRSSTSASATASWLSSRSGASRIRYLGGLLVPEVGELGVGERISEVVQVVSDVDDQDFFGATVLRTAEPSPDHLDVLVGRKRGSAEIDGVDLRCVESLIQDVEVREDFDLTIAEPSHQGSAPCGVGASVDRCRLDPLRLEDRRECLGVLDRRGEDDRMLDVIEVRRQMLDDRPISEQVGRDGVEVDPLFEEVLPLVC